MADIFKVISILKELIVGIFIYRSAKTSAKNDELEAKNKSMDKYAKIDAKKIENNEVYNEKNWL